jgi:hypothetical protein
MLFKIAVCIDAQYPRKKISDNPSIGVSGSNSMINVVFVLQPTSELPLHKSLKMNGFFPMLQVFEAESRTVSEFPRIQASKSTWSDQPPNIQYPVSTISSIQYPVSNIQYPVSRIVSDDPIYAVCLCFRSDTGQSVWNFLCGKGSLKTLGQGFCAKSFNLRDFCKMSTELCYWMEERCLRQATVSGAKACVLRFYVLISCESAVSFWKMWNGVGRVENAFKKVCQVVQIGYWWLARLIRLKCFWRLTAKLGHYLAALSQFSTASDDQSAYWLASPYWASKLMYSERPWGLDWGTGALWELNPCCLSDRV